MEKLLEQAKLLNQAMREIIIENEKSLAESNQLAAKNRLFSKDLESKKTDLDARANTIGNQEQLVRKVDEARQLKEECDARTLALISGEKACNEAKRDIAAQRSKLNAAHDEVKIVKEQLAKLREELKERIKNAKEDVLKELGKKIK